MQLLFGCGAGYRLGLLGMIALAVVLVAPGHTAPNSGRLTVRVVDAVSGVLLPSRVSVRDSAGAYAGDRIALSAARWPNLEAHGAFILGEQSFELPAGPTRISAAHGLEYVAQTKSIELAAGGSATVEFRLSRVFDMRKAGWVSGDLHVHMIHGENQRRTSYADVATTCAGGGLDFVSVCQEWVGAGTMDLAGYQAECAKVSNDRFRMLLGAERPQSLLGHQVLLGVPDPFVINEDPPYYRSARKVRAQGGAVAYVHPVRYFPGRQYQGQWLDFPGNNLARELVYDAFLGPSFDGISVLSDEPANPEAHALWFHLLNRGLPVPALADSDACFDRPNLELKTPGFWSTYFYVGPGGTVDGPHLAQALRRGQTLATTGPLLQFHVDDSLSGATLPPDGKERTVRLEAWLPQHAFTLETRDPKSGRSEGISRIELIRNGTVVKSWEPHSPHATATFSIRETEPCWYAARVFGEDAKWQVAVASPIYFGEGDRAAKREPFTTEVRGRIYDFRTGQEREGTVEIRRDEQVLKRFPARGQFHVRMPLDAEISVEAPGFPPERRELWRDYGPIHRFLWYLESKDLAQADTFERFRKLVEHINLEFPLGYRLPGSYRVTDLPAATDLSRLQVIDGPPAPKDGTATVAAVLLDTDCIQPGDVLHAAVLYRDEGNAGKLGPLVVEARGYDRRRPSAFEELKKFDEFERTWATATDLGNGYRLLAGEIHVPAWVEAGPAGGVDLSVRARQGNADASFLGLLVPLGPTHRALSLSTAWPTLPVSWPDRNYGLGPFRLCNRVGRAAQPRGDYRQLHLKLDATGRSFDLLPARDARGCPDADDALYTGQYLDQCLAEISHLAQPDPIRPQPLVTWRDNLPLIDATRR